MARPVNRKARKDYPNDGIKKGDQYWYVKIKTGARSSKVMRQIAPFKPSQLTSSPYLSTLYGWEESKSQVTSPDDLEDLITTIRELGEQCQESFENMPEGLQQGDTGQLLEERANACEEAANELEEIQTEWQNADDTCSECDGSGQVTEDCTSCNGLGEAEEGVDCSDCDGTGDIEEDCDECNGSGEVEADNQEFIDRIEDVSVDA